MEAFVNDATERAVKTIIFRIGRRFGKTHYLVWRSARKAVLTPGYRCPFIAPTVKALKNIVIPIFNSVLRDCPQVFRPEFKKQDAVYCFGNGAELPLAGTDNGHAEKIRGTRADDLVLDEMGFMTDLKYVFNDICLPTLMYGNGVAIGSSTPPVSPDHYFVELLMHAEIKNAAMHKTIWDNPMLSLKEILEFAEAQGCVVDWDKMQITEKSIAFRREFEAEILVDPDHAVIPEFTEEKAQRIVKEWNLPPYCNKYIIIDTGYVDFTAVIFGYWDFDNAIAVVDSDMLINFSQGGMNTEKLAGMIIAEAETLWGDASYLCHGDGDLIVLNELSRYGLNCSPVKKDNLEAQVNSARVDVQNEKVRINPKRAKNTIAHVKYAVWNKRRNAFERTEDHGHYDCLAAFIYFLRHLNRNHNPYPIDYNIDPFKDHVESGYYDQRDNTQSIRKILNLRPGGR